MDETNGRYVGMGFTLLAMACWFGSIGFGIRARVLKSRATGIPWHSERLGLPWRDCPAGATATKWCWACIAGFLACCLLAGPLSGWLAQGSK
jgi:hypothetical protein